MKYPFSRESQNKHSKQPDKSPTCAGEMHLPNVLASYLAFPLEEVRGPAGRYRETGLQFIRRDALRKGQGLAHRHTAGQRQMWPWGGDPEREAGGS